MKQYISERKQRFNMRLHPQSCLAPPEGEQDTDRVKAEADNRKMKLHLSISYSYSCSVLPLAPCAYSESEPGRSSISLLAPRQESPQCICNEYKSRYITSGYGPAPALNHFLFPSDQTADCINQRC